MNVRPIAISLIASLAMFAACQGADSAHHAHTTVFEDAAATPPLLAPRAIQPEEIRGAVRLLSSDAFEGRGVGRSAFSGVKWLRAAADAGDRGAARLLAMRLAEGDAVARDPAEAYRWMIVGTEGFGPGLWEVRLAEYRAKVPTSQRKASEEAARKDRERQAGGR